MVSNFRASTATERGRWLIRPYAGINNIFDERCKSNIRINAFGNRYYEPAPGRNFYCRVRRSLQILRKIAREWSVVTRRADSNHAYSGRASTASISTIIPSPKR